MLDPEQLVLCSILCQEQSESLHKTESVTVGEDAAVYCLSVFGPEVRVCKQKPDIYIYAPLHSFHQ